MARVILNHNVPRETVTHEGAARMETYTIYESVTYNPKLPNRTWFCTWLDFTNPDRPVEWTAETGSWSDVRTVGHPDKSHVMKIAQQEANKYRGKMDVRVLTLRWNDSVQRWTTGRDDKNCELVIPQSV